MTTMEEDDIGIDSVLLTVENPVRRKIIRRLSMEPSYQLRISKELGFSQQLVAKHLDAMEDSGVVSSQMEASPHGPKRKEYLLNRSISLTIDFAPNLFRARVMEFDPLPELDLPGASGDLYRLLAEVVQRPEENTKLRPLTSLIREIDKKLAGIEDERSILLYIRNLAMKEVSKAIGGVSSSGWDEKRVVNQLVDEDEDGLRDRLKGFRVGDTRVREVIADLERDL
ncbi:MAG: ArsR family transcriptional regulator [Nitrososphaerota archaeon]|jgi:predicted transcriptional regulator|nr:ArsR family transcriptional regulator [Nitrososphaerota archaeon]MDG6966522.1 ArsR family transcriptional regulator [Nitrososphaerota archaeon]MDG6978619.1 ArsR family transcriptional regulator [Nitrososphaerota archaeon]MDG7006243.1 ArsR family transcriptional regulator [Nitrososphaerota archaeon]MDG7020981.1 ArsR family transcriptional regulator [Nitrososphaerota archaeon]